MKNMGLKDEHWKEFQRFFGGPTAKSEELVRIPT